jgi:DNA-binding Xre family transcriptional regulator
MGAYIMNMANNLDEMISLAGMSKKAVAEEKGVTPETVSRHIHSKISMTMTDIDEYARILKCQPHEIAYTSPPIPILGVWYTDPATKNMKLINRFQNNKTYHKKGIRLHGSYNEDWACIYWNLDQNTQSPWRHFDSALTLIEINSVAEKRICQNAIMNKCYVMTKTGVMLSGVLWPQHHNALYTLTDVVGVPEENRILTDLDIDWAAPVTWLLQQRRMQTMEMVDYESPFIKKHYDKLVKPQSPDRKAQYEKIYQVNMNEPVVNSKTDGLKIVE